MEEKSFRVEMATENAPRGRFYFANLDLPAKDYEILDAHQRARSFTAAAGYQDIVITRCDTLPQLTDVRLDCPTMEELNFLASRLEGLSMEEQIVLQAVFQKHQEAGEFDDVASMKDLINMTYGLDQVCIIGGVWNDSDLGRFVIDNEMDDDIAAMPQAAADLLDVESVGRKFRMGEGGIFTNNHYVPTATYEMPEIYDGITLPGEQTQETWYAFRLKINKYELLPDEDSEQKAQWISLPVHPQEAKNIAKSLGAKQIEGCLYYEMESTIPQITADHYPNMRQFSKLNRLAEMMLDMSPDDQVKFKAVLDLERPADMDGILDCAIHLDDYHMEERLDDEQSYFQEYLSRMLPPEFDRGWLDSLICASEGHALLKKLDGKVTEYGVIAGRNRSLYEMVPCRDDLIIHPVKQEDSQMTDQEAEDFGMGGMQM